VSVLYCVAGHHRPAQFRRLVDTLAAGDGEGQMVLHYDTGGAPLDPEWVAALPPRVTVLPARALQWGSYGLVELFIEFLTVAAQRPDCSYVVFLSGQDYPIVPLGTLEERLRPFDVWMTAAPIDEEPILRHHRARYSYRWYGVLEPNRAQQLLYGASRRLLPGPEFDTRPHRFVHMHQGDQLWWGRRTRSGPGLPVYAGSQWMSLSIRAVRRLLAALETETRAMAFLRRVPIADEACLQTVMHSVDGLRWAPGNARFTRWLPGSGHPEDLSDLDVPALLASGDHFARKFDLDADPSVLDTLDAALGISS
jgi:hypothetical protein